MACTTEALRQFTQGEDFWSIADITGDLTAEQACLVPNGCPYSIATQLAHALFWQDRWLRELQGEFVPKEYTEEEDFPVVSRDEWPTVVYRFLAGMEVAVCLARAADPLAEKRLLQIALHGTYHAGQIALLRRIAGFGYPPDVKG